MKLLRSFWRSLDNLIKPAITIGFFAVLSSASLAHIPFPSAIPFPNSTDKKPEQLILGHWGYTHALYKGTVQPKRDPDLYLNYKFTDTGVSNLSWFNTRTGLYCSRLGLYEIKDGILYDKVTDLDPKNSLTCAEDPDMRLHTETATPVDFHDEEMHLHLSIGADPFIFVWTKKAATEPTF